MSRKSSTETLIAAMRILARDIQGDDGVANAAISEAADRLAELETQAAIGQRAVAILKGLNWLDSCPVCRVVGEYLEVPSGSRPNPSWVLRHDDDCKLAAILRDAEQAGMGVES